VAQREALVKQAAASLDLARIDLGYTEITAPISGRIGLIEVTKGNYVSPSTPRLARIVQEDPIRVVFSMSDREHIDSLQQGEQAYSVRLRLPNGADYPGVGRIDFADNEMSTETGAIANYGRFDNPNGLLIPGSYVTVGLENTAAPRMPVIPQEAVMLDAEGSFVFVVDAEGKAERRPIEAGPTAEGLQYVVSGLTAGEQVVVQGVQKVQPGQAVTVNTSANPAGAKP
jgi:membrane fusion protein (multidrug efflux system)